MNTKEFVFEALYEGPGLGRYTKGTLDEAIKQAAKDLPFDVEEIYVTDDHFVVPQGYVAVVTYTGRADDECEMYRVSISDPGIGKA